MEKKFSKIFAGSLLVLAISSCQKASMERPEGIQLATSSFNELNPPSAASSCGVPIPDTLQVPDGNKLAYQVYANGVQIYQVRRSAADPNVFVWVNTAPDARLYLRPDYLTQVGTHYAGPSWEFTKGPYKNEKAVASKLRGVTVDATAIPWLLLKTVDSLSSPGNKVTYIQRVCTTGGMAPSITPNESNLGQVENIPYTATYIFYEKKN